MEPVAQRVGHDTTNGDKAMICGACDKPIAEGDKGFNPVPPELQALPGADQFTTCGECVRKAGEEALTVIFNRMVRRNVGAILIGVLRGYEDDTKDEHEHAEQVKTDAHKIREALDSSGR